MVPRTVRVALAASVLFAFLGAGFWIHALIYSRSPVAQSASGPPSSPVDALQSAFVRVAERVRPAVVHIGTVQVAEQRRAPLGPGAVSGGPPFKELFGPVFRPPRPRGRGE